MKKLIMLAMAAMALVAFAIPATASAANEFTHEGGEIGEAGVEAEFAGPAGFVVAAAPTEGVHCKEIVVTLKVTTTTAHIVAIHFIGCTATSSGAGNNLPTDATLIAKGHVVVDTATRTLTITGVHINNKVTAGGVVVGESTLKGGTITALVPEGQQEAIETVSLGDEGVKVESPPGSEALEANVLGDLTSNGTIGIK